uniref:Uncharacterized protein n=1 Tax=viral metagenome TaxID=1070528 RepID=A0A6C0JSC0_9ZZZZ
MSALNSVKTLTQLSIEKIIYSLVENFIVISVNEIDIRRYEYLYPVKSEQFQMIDFVFFIEFLDNFYQNLYSETLYDCGLPHHIIKTVLAYINDDETHLLLNVLIDKIEKKINDEILLLEDIYVSEMIAVVKNIDIKSVLFLLFIDKLKLNAKSEALLKIKNKKCKIWGYINMNYNNKINRGQTFVKMIVNGKESYYNVNTLMKNENIEYKVFTNKEEIYLPNP